MANSYVEIPVTGVDSYTFPFPYIEQSHISVSVDGVTKTLNTHYTFTDSNTIEFTAGNIPVDTSIVIRIARQTDAGGRLVEFSNTGLDADDLNLSAKQNFYIAQESIDTANANITKGVDGSTTVNGRLSDVFDPIDDQDAATKAYVARQLANASGSVTIDANPPNNPVANDLWVDTAHNIMYLYTGNDWINGATVESHEYRFTGANMGNILGNNIIVDFTVGTANIREVFLNGVRLQECTTALDFTTGDWDRSTSLIVFENALDLADEIVVTTTAKMTTALANAVMSLNTNIDAIVNAEQDAQDAAQSAIDAAASAVAAQNAADEAGTNEGFSNGSADLNVNSIELNGNLEITKNPSQLGDGTFIKEVGTGSLFLQAADFYMQTKPSSTATDFNAMRIIAKDGATEGVELHHGTSLGGINDYTLKTTGTGVSIKGTAAVDDITLTSPDGLTTKTLSLSNTGDLELDGVALSGLSGGGGNTGGGNNNGSTNLVNNGSYVAITDSEGNNILDDAGVMLTLENLGYTLQDLNDTLGDI